MSRQTVVPSVIKEIKLTDNDDVQYRAYYDGKKLEIEEVKPETPPPQTFMQEMKEKMGKKEEQEEQEKQEKQKSEGKSKPPKLDDNTFKQKLGSIMSDNKFDRRQRGRLKGKLDATRLSRVATGSENLFTQKVSRKNKMYNVILLVDNSGSMAHRDDDGKNRYEHAAESATFLAKSFVGININLQVMMFNHFIWTVKGFDETVDFNLMFKELNQLHSGGGCNHDYSAMHEAYRQLEGRKGENILVLLSDGQPAECHPYEEEAESTPQKRNPKDHVLCRADVGKEVSKNRDTSFHTLIQKNARIASTVALGMQSQVKQVPDSISVNNMSEMKSALLRLLSKKIRRA